MPPTMDEALCIRQWDFSETSQTVSLLCRGLGLVRGLAKGAKRATHPFSGGIELLTRASVGVITRPSSDLALITEWDLQETFPALRRSLAAHHVGLYIAELIQHAVHDHDPHTRLFDEALHALRLLHLEPDHHALLARFQWALLLETGYKPELDHDVLTTAPLPHAPWYFFDPRLGGLVAQHHPVHTPAPPHIDASLSTTRWRVRRETIVALLDIHAQLEPSDVPIAHAGTRTASHAALTRAAKFLAAYARYVFGREPRMMSVLFGSKLPR